MIGMKDFSPITKSPSIICIFLNNKENNGIMAFYLKPGVPAYVLPANIDITMEGKANNC